jgi:hypothetical protein
MMTQDDVDNQHQVRLRIVHELFGAHDVPVVPALHKRVHPPIVERRARRSTPCVDHPQDADALASGLHQTIVQADHLKPQPEPAQENEVPDHERQTDQNASNYFARNLKQS